jgi:regulator of protease activity HflC (stomatin/prohibitin superfamily)
LIATNTRQTLTDTHLASLTLQNDPSFVPEITTKNYLKFPVMKTLNNNRIVSSILVATALSLSISSCKNEAVKVPAKVSKDLVYSSVMEDIRLGDGVPLDINLSVRWKIEDYAKFSSQFETPNVFDSLVIAPRQLELANIVANHYNNVDSVFTGQRHAFVSELKAYLMNNLGEEGVTIKEVIVADVIFPSSYTSAMEQLAMQEQELERIRKQAVLELEKSVSERQQAEEDGKVSMAKAEMNAKVQKINAETEKSIRSNRLAQAETQKQVAKLEAQAQAEREELMAEVQLKKQREQKSLEVKHQRDMDLAAIEKQKQLEGLGFDQDMKMAKLCTENPAYANYMVNKELASKVQIAVLPSNQDASVFSGLLNNSTAAR